MKKIAMLLVLSLAFMASPVWALDGPVDKELAKLADNDSFAVKAPGMALYGLYEIGEAPLEALNQPMDHTLGKKDYKLGLFKGINGGLFKFMEGTTRGMFDVLRSLVPGMGRFEDKDHQTRMLPGLSG